MSESGDSSMDDSPTSEMEFDDKPVGTARSWWGVIVIGLILILGAVIGSGFIGRRPNGFFSLASLTPNQKLRESLERFDASVAAGNAGAFVAARQDVSDRLVEWIDDFTAHADLAAAFTVGDDEVCAGCQLLPRAMKALSDPVPPNVLANMTQLDKDRLDVKKVPWSIVNAFVPAFNQLCDRYVDPATGKMRMAKPD